MSTPTDRSPAPKRPFGPLSAILTGVVLGFFAFIFMPDSIRQTWRSFAQTATVAETAKRAGETAVAQVPPQAATSEKTGKMQLQAEEDGTHGKAAMPAPEGVTKEAPALIPAQDIQYPKPFSASEMTAALEPLLSFKLNEGDAKAVKEAFEAAARENDGDARAAIQKIGDPSAQTFAEWKRLRQHEFGFRGGHGVPGRASPFSGAAPDSLLEKKLFLSDTPAPSVLKYYTNRVPVSGAGHAGLAAALIETGSAIAGSN